MSKKKYWLHRISHHYEIAKPLLDMGYLSYGFRNFAVIDDYITNTIQFGEKYIDSTMVEYWGQLSRNRSQLVRYLLEMKAGDYVIVPTSGEFIVCEILEDAPIVIGNIKEPIKNISGIVQQRDEKNNFIIRKDGSIVDLGFARRIRIIEKNISRNKYADAALVSRMKARQTNLNISDLSENIEKAIIAKRENKKISLRSEISEINSIIKQKIVSSLNPDKFEKLVKWYFKRIGATSVDIPAKNDKEKEGKEDVDIIATFESLRTIYYIQAKHHKETTGDWAVKQINGVKERKANNGMDDGYNKIYWVVSSGDKFSASSQELARENEIQLIDGDSFVDMLIDSGFFGVDNVVK